MPLLRLWAPGAVALLLFLALATLTAPARAAIGVSACTPAGFVCESVPVPLDRTGAVPGQVPLLAQRLAASPTGTPTPQAVIALAGGPGQAATPFAADFAESLKPFLAGRDLVVFDQRGTGASGGLSCNGFSANGPSTTGQVRACADSLGLARDYYRTPDSAEDIEALRVAGGYDKLVLYGVSYGTRLALTYAALHPDRVAALILDSVVPLDGPDVWARPSFAALGRVLGDLCSGGACRGASKNALGDLRRLSARLERSPLRGRITAPAGGRLRVELTRLGLWQILLAGDLNPALRAEFPGAVSAALRGDATPILRLRARAVGLTGTAQSGAPNSTLFVATRCSETAFPWTAAAADQRIAQARGAITSLPAATFAPFSPLVAYQGSVAALCAYWPGESRPEPALGPLPQVPTLVLSGSADLRTPLEEARRAVSAIPDARVVPVAGSGHSVLGSDVGGCADDEVAAFAQGTTASCTPEATPFTPTPRPPLRLRELPGRSRVLKAVEAVRLTLNDVRRQLIGDAIAAGRPVRSGSKTGGLRGGVATVAGDFANLTRVVYVPGLRVSGVYGIRKGAASRLAVTGSTGVQGRIDISTTGAISGILNGVRVRSVKTAASAGARDDLARALGPHPGLRRIG